MTSKIVVNNIEADSGVSTVTFGSDISASKIVTSSTSTFSNGLNVTGGNVGIGTDSVNIGNSDYRAIQVHAPGTNSYLVLTNNSSGADASNDGVSFVLSGSDTNILNRESGDILLSTGGGERARVTSGGNVQIANGNLVFSTSGTGIDFSATADGSGTTTSELLDDYEEGTWTPTLGNFTGTYTTQSGIYTKIGNIVTLNVHINVATNTGTSSLSYWIQGMPFNIVGTPTSSVGPVYIYEAATSTGHMISSMNTQQRWYVHPNNGLTSATSTNGHQAGQLGTGQIFATITYRVA